MSFAGGETSHVIGIDLGTTYSAVAVLDDRGKPQIVLNEQGSPTTPSVVLFEDDSVTVGQFALDMAVAMPNQVAQYIKRHMGTDFRFTSSGETQSYTPEEVSALILKKIVKEARDRLGWPEDDSQGQRCVITVPAYFNDSQRRATRTAGEIAGLEVLGIINEPTAAAVAFGVLKSERIDQTILVYDFGGGTFDVTILRVTAEGGEDTLSQDGLHLQVIATGGDHQLGGKDINQVLVDHVVTQFKEKHGVDPCADSAEVAQDVWQRCEKAKRQLTERAETRLVISAAGKTLSLTLTREDLDALCYAKLEMTVSLVEQCLTDAKMTPQDIDVILLVGGSTRLKAVHSMLRDLFGKDPDTSINPDEAVALGAAIYAATLDTTSGSKAVQDLAGKVRIGDVASVGLGVEIIDRSNGEKPVHEIMVKRNTPVPAEARHTFETVRNGQTSVKIPVLIGDHTDPQLCTRIGEAVVDDLPPGRPPGQPLEAVLRYNEQGVIELVVTDVNSQRAANVALNYAQGMSEREKQQATDAVARRQVD